MNNAISTSSLFGVAALDKMFGMMPKLPEPKVCWCHPDTFEWLKREFATPASAEKVASMGLPPLDGIEVRVSPIVPRFASKWEFPREPFFEYEESDEDWCRFFGFGGEVETDEPLLLMMRKPDPAEFIGTFAMEGR